MTEPKRMTAERRTEIQRYVDDDCVCWAPRAEATVRELLAALSAERAHSAKVEARCEELRKGHLEQWSHGESDGLHFGCQLCGQEFPSPEQEMHVDGCLAAPTEKT